MIQAATPTDAKMLIRNAAFDGCDAYGYQNCQMGLEYRTEGIIRDLYNQMSGKPIYVTNYKNNRNEGRDEADLMDELVRLIEYGATLADIPGDTFCPDPIQMTKDEVAIDRQRRVIERIHEAGGEVLMSAHVMKYLNGEQVLEIAHEQKRRGADVVKIVTAANSDDEEIENLRTTQLLARELDGPFLFISGGTHNKRHRMLGFAFGCSMVLCVGRYDPLATMAQPLLRAEREIVTNLDYYPSVR